MRVVSEPGLEVVHDNRCQDRLAGSGDTWTEKSLLRGLSPLLVFSRVQQPLPCARLLTSDEIALLATVVGRCDPVENSFVFPVCLPVLLLFSRLCDFFVNVGVEGESIHSQQAVQGAALTLKILDRLPCQKGALEPLPANSVALGPLCQVDEKAGQLLTAS